MRIISEETSISAAPDRESRPSKAIASGKEPEIQPSIKHRQQRRRGSCMRLLIALLALFLLLAGAAYYLATSAAGPLVQSVSDLPDDFPGGLALYQLEQAALTVQSPESKERLSRLIESLPEWSLAPFLGYLTADIKSQISARLRDPNIQPEKATIGDLGRLLSGSDSQTVGLKWDNLPQTKEALYEYYKSQLIAQGYTVKERIGDYEIDLSFFKPGVDGAMTIADSFMKDDFSVIKMTIDYLSQR